MVTSGTPQGSSLNEEMALESDIDPFAHSPYGYAKAIERGLTPERAAALYGAPPAPAGSAGPQTAQLDLSRIQGNAAAPQNPPAANQRSGDKLDLSRIAPVSRETPTPTGKAPLQLTVHPEPGGGLFNEFMSAINSPEEELSPTQHATYAGRLRDIPHDVASYVRSGVDQFKKVGDRETGQGTAGGLVQDFLHIVGGAADIGLSPVLGPTTSMLGRPIAERLERKDPHTAEERAAMSPFERAKAATPHYKVRDPEPVTDEEARGVTDLISVALPGVGFVRYGELAGRIRASPVGQVVNRMFSPASVSDDSRIAAGMIRGAGGNAARSTEMTQAVLDAHRQALRTLPADQQLNFISGAVEGGPRAINAIPSAPLRDLARTIRQEMQLRENTLRSLPSTAGADFVEDYFPHMWQDPNRARAVFGGGTGSPQGSGASMRARTIPTIADGIAQGLVPVTTDPIEMVMRYVRSIDRFIASEATRDLAIQHGYAQWIRPRVVGASGHPQSYDVPEGWVQLGGRGSSRLDGSRLYAPEDFAAVYNNFISQGPQGAIGDALRGAQHASNAITALELSLSAFHASAMTVEAAVSRAARGVQNITGGVVSRDVRQILRGVGQMATAPVAAPFNLARGRAVERAYLGTTRATPDMARILDLLEQAGGRAVGSRHANIAASAQDNFYVALRRAGVRATTAATAADIRARPVAGSMRTLGRLMDTLVHPLFNVAIPRLKNGAFYETMSTWLHNHPNATVEEQIAGARQVWDSIDNRFGELVQDNIFWPRTMKLAAQLGMRSYSWNLGTIREIAGGATDILRGQGPVDSTRAAYVIALPFAVGYMNAIYQYLKTGEAPQSIDDLVAPRTGGTSPGEAVPSMKPFGRSQRTEVPERVILPGYQKDVFGWYDNWQQEMINKVATGPRTAYQLLMNEDWRGQPIVNPEASAPEWVKQYFNFMLESYGPISTRQLAKGEKLGSSLTTPEMLGGIRPAPGQLQDPESHARARENRANLRWRQKENIDRRTKQLYGGTDEE